MAYVYRPRGMPARFMQGAPDTVRARVLDVIRIDPPAPLDFDVVLRPDPAPRDRMEIAGVDFDRYGARGCHFFLTPREMVQYRDRNRRKRVAWPDLPAATQSAILAYLGE